MKQYAIIPVLILILFLPGCNNTYTPRQLPPIEVHFSPKGGCTDAIVNEIDAAQTSLLIQAYSFTSAPIAKAINNAHKRGVRVEAILDHSKVTEKYTMADYLHNAGVQVLVDGEHAIAHNKIIIIDGRVIITGSFNFTKNAEQSNAENLLVIRDSTLADQYTTNWKQHAAHSEEYAGKSGSE